MLKRILKPCLVFLLFALPLKGLCQLPFPKWVNDIGGSGASKAAGMATDNQNNIYLTGFFSGTVDFDPSAGVTNLTSVGGYDTYVAKYATDGSLIWAVSMGGDGLDQVNYLTVDNNGNTTITGQFQSTTFNAGTYSFPNQGAEDIFVVHLNTNGGILWAKSVGSFGTDRGEEVNADDQGNVIVTSIFQESITLGATTLTASGSPFNGLVIKYDSNGNLLWDLNLGTTGDTEVYGNGVDANNNIIIAGYYDGSVDFDPLGAHDIVNATSSTGFVAKYTPAGKLIWLNSINGSLVANQSVVNVDSNNDIYVTGAFTNLTVFNGSISLTPSGSQDTFLAKYSSAGAFEFVKDIGGSGASSFPYQIRTDKSNNVYITGYFNGTIDFDPDPTTTALVSYHGQRDFFLAEYNSNGNYQWAFSGGNAGCNSTFGVELAIDNNNDVLLGGAFCQTVDFDPSTCATDNVTAQNFQNDTYIAKYIQSATLTGQITGLTMPEQISPAVIDQVNHTVTITVAYNSNIKSLTPTIAISGGTLSPASGVTQDFTSTVIYTLTSNCSSIPYNVKVILAAPPTQITVCSGTSNTITGDAANPVPGSYLWQELQNGVWVNAPGVVSNKDYQTSALLNNTTADAVFSLRRQITTSGVVSYDSFYDVTVQSSVAISSNVITAPGVVAFCTSGDPAIITGSTPAGGNGTYTYQWQSSADNITFADVPGAAGKDYDPPLANTNIYYRRVVTSGICAGPSTSNIITIFISSIPTAPSVVNPVTVCSGSVATLSVSNPQASLTYNWYTSSASGSSVFTGANFVTPALTANTTYYVEAVNSGGCASVTRTAVNTTVNAQPQVTTQGTSVCPGTSATITASSTDQNATINWYSSATGGNSLFTGNAFITPVLNSATTYYAEATDNVSNCSSAVRSPAQVQIIQPLPAPVVSVAATTVSSVTFQWNAVNGATGYQISIDNGQTFTDPSSGSNGLTHMVSGLQLQQSVTIIVRAVGSSSCASSGNSTAVTGIAASPLGDQIFVANAFTPNGDGRNDIVYVHSANIKNLKFYIYDQWGELLYTSLNQANGWDGTYKGSKEPVGVYVYYLEATMNDGQWVNKKGTITLLR